MVKKEAQKKSHFWRFDLCYLLGVYSKYSNRAVTVIQQSCISNTLIEQSPHIAYAIHLWVNMILQCNIVLYKAENLNCTCVSSGVFVLLLCFSPSCSSHLCTIRFSLIHCKSKYIRADTTALLWSELLKCSNWAVYIIYAWF